MLSSTFSAPSLCPVWLDLGNLVCVFQRIFVVLLGGVGSRSIRVQNVIGRFDGDSFSKLGTSRWSITIIVSGCQVNSAYTRDVDVRRWKSKQRGFTYTASSKFFSAMALLPRALSASAILKGMLDSFGTKVFLSVSENREFKVEVVFKSDNHFRLLGFLESSTPKYCQKLRPPIFTAYMVT